MKEENKVETDNVVEEEKKELLYSEKYPNYKYYEFPDGSIYFGETMLISKEGKVIKDISEITVEEDKALVQTLKHGFGIMLYGTKKDENGVIISYESKYEGKWNKDKKSGTGKVIYKDGSKYEGTLENDKFEGKGTFKSCEGHKFTGNFIEGRMEGKGVFKHRDGHILEGMFKNNYYYNPDAQCFIYPYLSKEETEIYKLKNYDFCSKTKTNLEKFSRENLIRVTNQNEIMKAIDKTFDDNKIPLIIRSKTQNVSKNDIFSMFGDHYKEIDLRYFYNQLHRNSLYLNVNIYNELKEIVTEAISKGYYLILNFDDCKEDYTYKFDPDIREFYGIMMLSPYIWNPKLFKSDRCSSAHMNYRDDLKMDKNFKFICYSKYICNESIPEHDRLNFIEKRFEKCFPLVSMNILIYTQPKEETES